MKPGGGLDTWDEARKIQPHELVALPCRGEIGKNQHEIDVVGGDLGMIATRRGDAAARRKLAIPADFLDIGAGEFGDVAAGVVMARSEEHTSELQSLMRSSYAVFCLKKKKTFE